MPSDYSPNVPASATAVRKSVPVPEQGVCKGSFLISAFNRQLRRWMEKGWSCAWRMRWDASPATRTGRLRAGPTCGHTTSAVTSCSLLSPPGLSPALPHRGDPDPSGRGKTHHAEGKKPAPAPVRPARVRVCPQHPGRDPPRACPALQQLQRPVPEQLGEGLGGDQGKRCPKWVVSAPNSCGRGWAQPWEEWKIQELN